MLVHARRPSPALSLSPALALLLCFAALPACDDGGRDTAGDSGDGINVGDSGDSGDDNMVPEPGDDGDPGEPGDDGAIDEPTETLDQIFAAASKEFDVPVEILKAISLVETQWQMVDGAAEFDGQEPGYGVMALRGYWLEEGSARAGVTLEEAKTDALANVRSAASLLSALADQEGLNDRTNIAGWAPIVAIMSGIEDIDAQASYIHDEVYTALAAGYAIENASLSPVVALPDFQFPPKPSASPNYAAAVWRPSPNFSSRPGGSIGEPAMVIIHTCEGSYSGCWSWLANGASGVSAHYVVNNTGSEISQLVDESKKAWHIAAKYKCSLNNSLDCWRDGYSNNNFTIGIEHAGYANQNSWDSGLIQASAKLVCDITKDQGIPRDKYHIVGHGQLQPYNRVDPGPNWPWTQYLNLVKSYCGEGQAPDPDPQPDPDPDPPNNGDLSIIIDSNNAKNGADAEIIVSGNWNAANSTPGYYNTGYWWQNTDSRSDAARFRFHLDQAATLKVEGWWTAGTNRSDAAPFVMFNAGGTKLGTKYANQQINGKQWVDLGTYDFTAGWNEVDLSIWAAAGSVVIADAVRVRTP